MKRPLSLTVLLTTACNWSPPYNKRTYAVESNCEGVLMKKYVVDPEPSRLSIKDGPVEEATVDNPNVLKVSFDGNNINIQFKEVSCSLPVNTQVSATCRDASEQTVCSAVATLVAVDEEQPAGSPAQY